MGLRLENYDVCWSALNDQGDQPFITTYGWLVDTDIEEPPYGSHVTIKMSKAGQDRRILEWPTSRDPAPNAMTKVIAAENVEYIQYPQMAQWTHVPRFLDAMHHCQTFVGKEPGRKHLTGICIDPNGTMVATDAQVIFTLYL